MKNQPNILMDACKSSNHAGSASTSGLSFRPAPSLKHPQSCRRNQVLTRLLSIETCLRRLLRGGDMLQTVAALAGLLAIGLALPVYADTANGMVTFNLAPSALVDSQGLVLTNLVSQPGNTLPLVKVAGAPAVGKSFAMTRKQLEEVLRANGLVANTNLVVWTGAQQCQVSRRMRNLEGAELRQFLQDTLQRDVVRDRGELELQFPRSQPPLSVPDEALTMRIVDIPATGFISSMIVRFELKNEKETFGPFQIPVQLHVMREIWVARSPIQRGTLVRDADLVREKRDMLAFRDPLGNVNPDDYSSELTETLTPGQPLLTRSIRPRPAILRGKLVEAILQEGNMTISVKVEALEDGAPGQYVRVRNLQSRREFRGKVANEQTVIVSI